MTTPPTSIYDLASRIATHLRRFALDPALNPRDQHGSKLHGTDAFATNGGVRVIYVGHLDTGRVTLTDREALAYLAWLDEGGVGTFAEMNGVVDPRWAAASNGVER